MALALVDRVSFTYPRAGCPGALGRLARVEPGEIVALLGPSGSGKSTLGSGARRPRSALSRRPVRGPGLVDGLDTRRDAARRARRDGRDGLPGPGGPGRHDARRGRGRVRAREPRRAAAEIVPARAGGARRCRRRRISASGGRGRALGRRAPAGLPRVRARAAAGAAPSRRADLAARPGRQRRSSMLAAEPRARARHGGARLRAAPARRALATLRPSSSTLGRASDCPRRQRRRWPRTRARATPSTICAPSRVSFAYGERRFSRAPRARRTPRRDRRLPGRTAPARRRSRSSRPGLLELASGSVAAPRSCRVTSRRIRAAISSANGPTRRSRSARRSGARGPRLALVGLVRASRSATRATSRAASASGSRSRRCSSPSRSCSSSTSRRAASTPSGRPRSRHCSATQAAGRATLVATHDRSFAAAVADREVSLGSSGPQSRCLGSPSSGGRGHVRSPRPGPRSTRARAGLSLLLAAASLVVGGAAWLETGPGSAQEVAIIGDARRCSGRRSRALRGDPGRAAGDRHRRRRRGGARAARRHCSRRHRCARLELLPRAGPLDAVADARLGRLRGSAGLAAPLLRRRIPFAVLCFVLGFAFSVLMDLWEWYSFYPHTGGARVQMARGVAFDARPRGRQLRDRGASPGQSLRRLLERYGRQPANRGGLDVTLFAVAAAALARASPTSFLPRHQSRTAASPSRAGSDAGADGLGRARARFDRRGGPGTARDYLVAHEAQPTDCDRRRARGRRRAGARRRLGGAARAAARAGPAVRSHRPALNSTFWGILPSGGGGAGACRGMRILGRPGPIGRLFMARGCRPRLEHDRGCGRGAPARARRRLARFATSARGSAVTAASRYRRGGAPTRSRRPGRCRGSSPPGRSRRTAAFALSRAEATAPTGATPTTPGIRRRRSG